MSDYSLPQSRNLVTAIPGPKSLAIDERRKRAVAKGVSSAAPIYVKKASGAVIEDVDGNRILDLSSGIGVTTIGHADPDVVAAVQAQVAEFSHTMFPIAPYESFVEVVERLIRLTPGTHEKRGILLNTGAEAVENAIKIARSATGRSEIAVLDHAYHGRTNLTMAMTYKAKPYRVGFGPFAPGIHHVPNSYPFHDGLSGEEAAKRTISVLEKHIGTDDLAAIIAEPIQGEGGFIVPAPGYLAALQRWATEHGVVFIADEVQSGIARTGKWFASEYEEGFMPDLISIAKGVGGGMPLAAVVGRAEIMDVPGGGSLGGTYVGNPVSCAASLAVLDKMEREHMLDEALRIGEHLTARLGELKSKYPVIGDLRGRGAMIAIELVQPGTVEPNAAAQEAIVSHCVANGVLILNAGTYSNVVRFLPNLTVTNEQLDDAIGVIEEALQAL